MFQYSYFTTYTVYYTIILKIKIPYKSTAFFILLPPLLCLLIPFSNPLPSLPFFPICPSLSRFFLHFPRSLSLWFQPLDQNKKKEKKFKLIVYIFYIHTQPSGPPLKKKQFELHGKLLIPCFLYPTG